MIKREILKITKKTSKWFPALLFVDEECGGGKYWLAFTYVPADVNLAVIKTGDPFAKAFIRIKKDDCEIVGSYYFDENE